MIRPVLSSAAGLLRPCGHWLLWCVVAWLAARVLAGGAQLIWEFTHPSHPMAYQAYVPPSATLPIVASGSWHRTTVAEGQSDLPRTQLPLQIAGVLRGIPLSRSVVVLETPQGPKVAMRGDALLDEVDLIDITAQGLVLNNRRRHERLPWPSDEPAASADAVTVAKPTPSPDHSTSGIPVERARWPEQALRARFGNDYLDRLLAQPTRLLPLVQTIPITRGDTLRGYRLRPGRDGSLFDALPFHSGDVITAIAGHAANALSLDQLRAAFEDTSEIRVRLQRDGHPVMLVLELSP